MVSFNFPFSGPAGTTVGNFSKYPTQLDDAQSLPITTDLVTEVRAEVVNRLRDSIIATQTELGTQPSSSFGTVKARLDAIQGQLNQVSQDLNALEAEIGFNPSGTFDTVVERLDDIDAQFAALQVQIAAVDAALQAQIDALTAILAVSRQVIIPIISGNQDTNSATLVTKGATLLNTDTYPSSTFTIEVILQTTDAGFAATFELFNLTEGLVVAHPAVTTISTSATFISVTLTVGGADLPLAQNNILEGRISLGAGAGASERAICKYATIRSTPV